jgi:glyceraldehyde 3-phosphate dehydrogenase
MLYTAVFVTIGQKHCMRGLRSAVTTIHTTTTRISFGHHKDLRRARAATLSQIPTRFECNSSHQPVVIPELNGKLDSLCHAHRYQCFRGGFAFVPVEKLRSKSIRVVNQQR